jgi:hypothetical protein
MNLRVRVFEHTPFLAADLPAAAFPSRGFGISSQQPDLAPSRPCWSICSASIPALIDAGTRACAAPAINVGGLPATFDYEMLTKLGARLFDHADSMTNVAAHEIELDNCSNLATLRFWIMEIAEPAPAQAQAATTAPFIFGDLRGGHRRAA